MKIAVVRRQCGLEFGGAERYCANVSHRLAALGHQVTVVADSSSVREAGFLRARVLGRGSIVKNLSFYHSVRAVLADREFDCIYGLSRIKGADFLRISDPLHRAWLDLGYCGRKIPGRLLRFTPRHLSLLWQEKQAVTHARFIITNSNLVKKHLLKYYRASPERIFTIYNGVDLKRFSPVSARQRQEVRSRVLGGRQAGRLLLFAGSDYRRKGLFVLLEAVSGLVRELDFHLLVLGVSERKDILSRCRSLRISGKVTFLGFRPKAEKYYRASDLLCLPTYYDPFANVCLEAMACATPVITTTANGASELVERLDKALVVEPGDISSLREAAGRVLSMDSSRLTDLRNRCAELARQFGWERHVERLVRTFEAL